MSFEFLLSEQLPKMAWCARLRAGDDRVLVEHGPWVETSRSAFFEGAWKGSFEDFAFDRCDVVVGSGGKLSGDGVRFVTPSHVLERLHSIETREGLFVSNSLAYLLSSAGAELDPDYLFYESDFLTILKGFHRAKKTLPTLASSSVRVHYCGQILVAPDLGITRMEHETLPRFESYEGYVDYLRGVVRQVHANASSSERRVQYRPLTTISSGYDSAACAVLAREVGCTRTVSFAAARDYATTPAERHDDSGRGIAERLGLEVREFQRDDYLSRQDFPEAEFLACGNGGDDVVMAALEPELSRTLLFTGFRGDVIWDTASTPSESSSYHGAKDPSGASLTEFRLRVGFIHLPLPCLTFPRHADLDRVTRGRDMAPWRLENDYDRPIARRLVESAGVPREVFGQEKRAVTQPFWIIQDNLRLYSPTSARDLTAYTEAASAKEGIGPRLHKLVGRFLLQIVWRGNRYFERLSLRLPQSYRLAVSETPLRFHWAIDKMKERYRSFSRLPEEEGM